MTWFHIYDLLHAQDRFFPHGDVRPFAPLPTSWPNIEAMFRSEESRTRTTVEAAISEFIHRGSWPSDLSDREKVFLRARLDFGGNTALRLAVPISEEILLFPRPTSLTDEQLFNWLLNWQWTALGFDSWLLDLRLIFEDFGRGKRKGKFESFPLQPPIHRDDPPTWSRN